MYTRHGLLLLSLFARGVYSDTCERENNRLGSFADDNDA